MRFVRYLLYLYYLSDGLRNDSYSHKTVSKFSMHIESKTNQFEIVVKLLACFNTQFIVEESLN